MPTPLDYADPRSGADAGPKPQQPLLRAARLIGCAIVVLAGAVMLGSSVIAPHHYSTADALEIWGTILIVGGMLGFIVEYFATFFRLK